MDQQIEMIWSYCAANQIKFTFEFDDEKIEFTFPTDLVAQRVKAGLNQPAIERHGCQLIVRRRYDQHPDGVDVLGRAKKIQHILITIILMTVIYIGLFTWWIATK